MHSTAYQEVLKRVKENTKTNTGYISQREMEMFFYKSHIMHYISLLSLNGSSIIRKILDSNSLLKNSNYRRQYSECYTS